MGVTGCQVFAKFGSFFKPRPPEKFFLANIIALALGFVQAERYVLWYISETLP